MPINVEIKARVSDVSALRRQAEAIADGTPTELVQEDTFFVCATGRLKLRALSASEGELIFYERPDSTGPKVSNYVRVASADPGALRALLAAALGVRAVVRKRRSVYLLGQTRIHLDEVDGLGWFVELEVVLAPGQSVAHGDSTARTVMRQLGIAPGALVDRAYVDLLSDCSA